MGLYNMHQVIENIILKAGKQYMRVLHEADLNDTPSIVLICRVNNLDPYPLLDAIKNENVKKCVKKIKYFFVD